MRRGLLGLVIGALVAGAGVVAPVPAQAAPRADARWSQATIPSQHSSTKLHADVLRPANLPANAKTPVVVSIGPYFNHSATSKTTPASYQYDGAGPNERFYDFLDLSRLLQRGYTFVMVDLPGFGGSGGCTDWSGPSEQAATHDAVEWAAAQSWSTGKVALFGKSYDGETGLMGLATHPKGLAAVVSMEPVYFGYRYLYSDGVRFPNSVGTPAAYQSIQLLPGPLTEDPGYTVASAPRPWCDLPNLVQEQNDNPGSAFWQARDLSHGARGSTVPLFMTQGLLEDNTKPDGMFDFFNGLAGPNRAWFGQFTHVRGWEKGEDGRYLVGRSGFIDEVMRFLDLHLKGIKPAVVDPPIVVQDITGRYRGEAKWPPADAKLTWTQLRSGSYADDGMNFGTGDGAVTGLWSVSQPLPYPVWMAGEPVVEYDVAALPRANIVADLYDIDAAGKAMLMGRAARLLRHGDEKGTLKLYGQDWPLAAGHRVGLLLSGSNQDWWTSVPTLSNVTVKSARLGLPALATVRTSFLSGGKTSRMEAYLSQSFTTIAPATAGAASIKFTLPPAMATVSAAAVTKPPTASGRVLAVTGASSHWAMVAGAAVLGGALVLRRRRGVTAR